MKERSIHIARTKLSGPPLGRIILQGEERTESGSWLIIEIANEHQFYYRATGGDSNYSQRCHIFFENAPARTGSRLEQIYRGDPHVLLGGGQPVATSWYSLEPRRSTWTYYLDARYGDDLNRVSGMRLTEQGFERGLKLLVGFEDDGGDQDYNDYLIEIGIVEQL